MDDKKFDLCRLCLNAIETDDSVNLDSVLKNILLVLIPELNLDLTEDPKICTSCNVTIMTHYEFKNKCNETILAIKGKCKIDELPEKLHCHFCQVVTNSGYNLTSGVRDELRNCFPNWKMFVANLTLICKECLECMREFRKFTDTSLNTEGQLKTFSNSQDLSSRKKINLYEAVEFLSNSGSTLQFTETSPSVINTENDSDFGSHFMIESVMVKTEILEESEESEIVIKSEIDEDAVSQLENDYLDVKVEELEADLRERICKEETLDLQHIPSTSRITVETSTSQCFEEHRSTSTQKINPASNRKKRPRAMSDQASPQKQLKVKIKPETNSIGIQVNVRELIEHFDVGVQVNISELTSEVDVKSSIHNERSICKPKVKRVTTRGRKKKKKGKQ